MTDPSNPIYPFDGDNQQPPNPGLVAPLRDRGGVRTSRPRNLRKIANAIHRELEAALQNCRRSGGDCRTIESALASACARLGNCPAANGP